MGFLGFPSEKDMAELFGFVTPEDKANWEKSREANAQANPGTAKEMADKSMAPAMDMAKRGVQAQMHGAQNEAQRGAQPKERRVEWLENVDVKKDSDYGPGY